MDIYMLSWDTESLSVENLNCNGDVVIAPVIY